MPRRRAHTAGQGPGDVAEPASASPKARGAPPSQRPPRRRSRSASVSGLPESSVLPAEWPTVGNKGSSAQSPALTPRRWNLSPVPEKGKSSNSSSPYMQARGREQSLVTASTLPAPVMLKALSPLGSTEKIPISRICKLWKMLIEHSEPWRCVPDTLQALPA